MELLERREAKNRFWEPEFTTTERSQTVRVAQVQATAAHAARGLVPCPHADMLLPSCGPSSECGCVQAPRRQAGSSLAPERLRRTTSSGSRQGPRRRVASQWLLPSGLTSGVRRGGASEWGLRHGMRRGVGVAAMPTELVLVAFPSSTDLCS